MDISFGVGWEVLITNALSPIPLDICVFELFWSCYMLELSRIQESTINLSKKMLVKFLLVKRSELGAGDIKTNDIPLPT